MLSPMKVVKSLQLSAIIWKEEELFVAWCPEVDVASQGKSIDEALANLREALELYLSDEDVKKPAEAMTTPIVTLIKVKTE